MANQSFQSGLIRRIDGPPNGLPQTRVNVGPFGRTSAARNLSRPAYLPTATEPARAFRHGSGAGTDPMDTGFRRRKPRSPSPDRGRTNFQPGGPLTAGEWTDQIDGLQQQIQSLNKIVSDHACVIGKLKSELVAIIRLVPDARSGSAGVNFEKVFRGGVPPPLPPLLLPPVRAVGGGKEGGGRTMGRGVARTRGGLLRED